MNFRPYILLASIAFASGANAAPVIFADNFDAETPELNSTDFAHWDVIDGTVDTIQSGGYGINCVGNSGMCLDLDGSTGNSGELITKQIFGPGQYQLSFKLSGNQRNNSLDTTRVTFGDYLTNISMVGSEGFVLYNALVTVSAPSGSKLSFLDLGNDNVGMILDDVMVSAVPVPAAAWFLGSALMGLAAYRRKRSAQS